MTFADFDNQLLLQGPALARLTDEEFYDLCQHNPTLRLERTADHNIIAMPPAGSESSRKSSEIIFQLMLWNRQHRLGYVYESSAGFVLPDGSIRSPDAAWLSRAAFEGLSEAQRQGFPPVCPQFVVEVRSPSDGLAALRRKMEAYLANGVQLGILLDPTNEQATVYRPGQAPEELADFDRELSAEPVLPGFALDLRPLRRA
ncbi:Uma2 family endonuclease [Hymenobacter cheonanensis]|uniref:Uma2 family endonuclease n=1 Tax=Hymenobacter sp. CA2-7 TaxID=3063993 RepID=UPI0027128340|nr:Uma2 family endonuclease [Hymenobacter sp. CA2-7]MDO7883843.1 Uma2 family endonuclease [Hymenobacter sp. CA2-7]